MHLHGTPIEDVRRQVRRLYKTMRYIDPSILDQLDLDPKLYGEFSEGLAVEYKDVFGINSNPDKICGMNGSYIAKIATLMEPALCLIALNSNSASELHTAIDSWGGFDMIDSFLPNERERIKHVWSKFKQSVGIDLSAIERPRKFSFYEVRDADTIENRLPEVTLADCYAVRRNGASIDLDAWNCPAVAVRMMYQIEALQLSDRDQVRSIGEFESNRDYSIGVLATVLGVAELNVALAPQKIRLIPKRIQSHYGATLQ